jgi:hypothetical protein
MFDCIKRWTKKPRTVVVFQRLDGQWMWHEKGANGEITCSSEGFASKENAERAARDHCAARRIFCGA